MKIKVLSVNISEKKGTIKYPVDTIRLTNIGVVGDAHSGNWNRQVSLLAKESIEKFSLLAKRKINFGEFAENISTEGLLLNTCKPLDRFIGKNVELEVTQIGKKCYGEQCNIFKEIGNCIMPKEGIFARVVGHGELKIGDQLTLQKRIVKIMVITLSDRASKRESGPQIKNLLEKYFRGIDRPVEIEQVIIPYSGDLLRNYVEKCLASNIDIVLTIGGTGLRLRDVTANTIKPLLHKEIPGIMEMIKTKYGIGKRSALLSRGIAGLINQTLIYTLPGEIKAVIRYCNEILPTIEHSLLMIYGIDSH